ncbi:MAG TPA: cytochrome P460 family protein, partial [Alphaproteobacteria bacterium]
CAAAACNPCNPCNPCAAGAGAELTDAEARAAYDCAQPAMAAAYSRSGVASASEFSAWTSYATGPYTSATHGGRYVINYANATGAAYGRYEQAGTLAAGSVLAKPSFTVNKKGQVMVGPLFLMAKQDAGWSPDTLNWQYQMIMPDGSVFGTTNGAGSAKVQFCADCHNAMAEQDALMFLPDEYRR